MAMIARALRVIAGLLGALLRALVVLIIGALIVGLLGGEDC